MKKSRKKTDVWTGLTDRPVTESEVGKSRLLKMKMACKEYHSQFLAIRISRNSSTVNCQTLTPLAGAVNLFILTRTPSKPSGFIYIPAGDSGLFPATAEFLRITARRIRILSRSRACRARAYAREFASVGFLQPLENSRAAREFSGNLPENSFTGSGIPARCRARATRARASDLRD